MSDRAVLPSALGREAAGTLGKLLRERTRDVRVDDAFFTSDWSALWTELVAGGWTALADGPQPGADGDLGLLDLTAIAEEWGRRLLPLPFVETLAVRRWLADRPGPDRRLTYAVSAGGVTLVPFGAACDELAAGRAHRLVEPPAPAEVDRFAPSLPLVIIDAAPVALPRRARTEQAILTTATALGAAATSLERSVEYVKVRQQFGKPVGSFQAVKHRLADMHGRIELARSAIAWAAADPESTSLALRSALALSLRTAEDAIQVHGGIGYTWEAGLHWPLRHVMAARRLVAGG